LLSKKEEIMSETKCDLESGSLQMKLANRSEFLRKKEHILSGATVYLSGPMDFVASRVEEKKKGWRKRVSQFVKSLGTKVYDPWNKPEVIGMHHYGKEDEFSTKKRNTWSFEDSEVGDCCRAELNLEFWSTMHIDLRMVDTSDFLIAYAPTNIYSVGTVHEIVMACMQKKPVLFVSPPVIFPSLEKLQNHFERKKDSEGKKILDKLCEEIPLRPNIGGIPSMWYMTLLDGHYFFDGFGFKPYMKKFGWEYGALDEREEKYPPKRPLLPYLERLNCKIPLKYDPEQKKYIENVDWLIFNMPRK